MNPLNTAGVVFSSDLNMDPLNFYPCSLQVAGVSPSRLTTIYRSLGQSLSPAPLGDRLSAAETRRAAMDSIRAGNLQDRLAKVGKLLVSLCLTPYKLRILGPFLAVSSLLDGSSKRVTVTLEA